MTAESLLRLYPRAWRERYGAELVQLAGGRSLSAQQALDLVAGAVDAWTSPSVRAAVRRPASAAAGKGAIMVRQLLLKCSTPQPQMTTRDGLISAGVLLASCALLTALSFYIDRLGYGVTADVTRMLAFPGSVLFSMPFGAMKGQPRRAQAVIIGGCTAILVLISVVASQL